MDVVTASSRVAAEIRAELGRQDVSRSELGSRVGESQPWVSRRLNGQTPLTLDDVQRIATALGVPIGQILAPVTAEQVPA